MQLIQACTSNVLEVVSFPTRTTRFTDHETAYSHDKYGGLVYLLQWIIKVDVLLMQLKQLKAECLILRNLITVCLHR